MQTGAIMIGSQEADSRQLLARARAGDLESFDQIMIQWQRQVFHTALRILGNVEDAQDAAQEVFLRLYKYLHKIDPSRQISPWLFRVTINVCHDSLKKRRKTVQLPEILSADLSNAENKVDSSEDIKIMSEALRSLPEKERAAIVLRDVEGLSTKEVATILKSSETTVRSQICRARIKLKEFRQGILRRSL